MHGGQMGPTHKQRELGGEDRATEPALFQAPRSFGASGGQEAELMDAAPDAPESDNGLVALLRDQPTAGLAAFMSFNARRNSTGRLTIPTH